MHRAGRSILRVQATHCVPALPLSYGPWSDVDDVVWWRHVSWNPCSWDETGSAGGTQLSTGLRDPFC